MNPVCQSKRKNESLDYLDPNQGKSEASNQPKSSSKTTQSSGPVCSMDMENYPIEEAARNQSLASNTPASTSGRVMDMKMGPNANAGVTADGKGVFAEAAAIAGKDGNVSGQVLGVGIQVGEQNTAQVTGARFQVGSSTSGTHGDFEVLTASASIGVHNPDGSVGYNASAGATLVGASGTVDLGRGGEVTVGVAAGLGFAVHGGVRDQKRDGTREACGGFSAGPVSIGYCVPVEDYLLPTR